MVPPANWRYCRGNARVQQASSDSITQSFEAVFAEKIKIRGGEAVAEKVRTCCLLQAVEKTEVGSTLFEFSLFSRILYEDFMCRTDTQDKLHRGGYLGVLAVLMNLRKGLSDFIIVLTGQNSNIADSNEIPILQSNFTMNNLFF